MRRWFGRDARSPKIEPYLASHSSSAVPSGLGQTLIVCPALAQQAVPAGCIGIAIAPDGSSRRHASGQVIPQAEQAFWVHPGPWQSQLCLHPATPEIALKLRFVLDSPDPRVQVQRFDLFLASEFANEVANQVAHQSNTHQSQQNLALSAFQARLEQGLQAELANGNMECGACMSLPEWMRFRAQLERWLYTRFGLTIEDCALVDVGEQLDYAQILLQRAAAGVSSSVSPSVSPNVSPDFSPSPSPSISAGVEVLPNIPPPVLPQPQYKPALHDAAQLRRLFLELPDFTLRWRALNPAPGFFALQQTAAQRLSLLKGQVSAMPALAWANPHQTLSASQIAIRSAHLHEAMLAWDEAWSLLARLHQIENDAAGTLAQWQREQDHIDRILTNLEHSLAARAAVPELEV